MITLLSPPLVNVPTPKHRKPRRVRRAEMLPTPSPPPPPPPKPFKRPPPPLPEQKSELWSPAMSTVYSANGSSFFPEANGSDGTLVGVWSQAAPRPVPFVSQPSSDAVPSPLPEPPPRPPAEPRPAVWLSTRPSACLRASCSEPRFVRRAPPKDLPPMSLYDIFGFAAPGAGPQGPTGEATNAADASDAQPVAPAPPVGVATNRRLPTFVGITRIVGGFASSSGPSQLPRLVPRPQNSEAARTGG